MLAASVLSHFIRQETVEKVSGKICDYYFYRNVALNGNMLCQTQNFEHDNWIITGPERAEGLCVLIKKLILEL